MKDKPKWPKGTKLALINNDSLPKIGCDDLVPLDTVVTVTQDFFPNPPLTETDSDFVYVRWDEPDLRVSGGYRASRFRELHPSKDDATYYKAVSEWVLS